jgi:hypothetical protein
VLGAGARARASGLPGFRASGNKQARSEAGVVSEYSALAVEVSFPKGAIRLRLTMAVKLRPACVLPEAIPRDT